MNHQIQVLPPLLFAFIVSLQALPGTQTATACSQTAADSKQFNYIECSEHSIFLPGKRSDLTQCLSVAFLYYHLFAQVTMGAQRKGK